MTATCWHKNRVFNSEVFPFEELGVELITPGLYRVFFRDMEIGEVNSEELRFRADNGRVPGTTLTY